MEKRNCNGCSLLLVIFAILVILGLIHYNNLCKNKKVNNIENFKDNSKKELMLPDFVTSPTEDPFKPKKNTNTGIQYVRPITDKEFQQIFKDFYKTASKLASSTKKMKEIMDEYSVVYEENANTQEEFDRLKDELQNGIKALG